MRHQMEVNRTILGRPSCQVKPVNSEAMASQESSQNCYTAESGLVANLKDQLARLSEQFQLSERMHAVTLQRVTATCAQYTKELEEARAIIASVQETKHEVAKMPFLDRHLNAFNGNYAEENIPIYIEMAQCGEGIWSTFVHHMGFPSWRTIQRWRKSMRDVHGFSRDLLDGSPEHLDKLFNGFFGESRYFLASHSLPPTLRRV